MCMECAFLPCCFLHAQVELTVRDLVRALSKMVLLYHVALAAQPGWGTQWKALMDVMTTIMAAAQVRPDSCMLLHVCRQAGGV